MSNKKQDNNKRGLKFRNPRTDAEIDMMYKRAFYIGKMMLIHVQNRYDNFRTWIKNCKDAECPIRFVYSDTIYDFEIQDKNSGKWFRVGQSTSRVLLT